MKYSTTGKKIISGKDGKIEQDTVHITYIGKTMEETYQSVIKEQSLNMKCTRCGFEYAAPS